MRRPTSTPPPAALAELAQCEAPHLAILGYRLAEGPVGLEVAAELRQRYPAIRRIMMTGELSQPELADTGMPVLKKPVAHDELRRAIAESLAASLAGCSRLAPPAGAGHRVPACPASPNSGDWNLILLNYSTSVCRNCILRPPPSSYLVSGVTVRYSDRPAARWRASNMQTNANNIRPEVPKTRCPPHPKQKAKPALPPHLPLFHDLQTSRLFHHGASLTPALTQYPQQAI